MWKTWHSSRLIPLSVSIETRAQVVNKFVSVCNIPQQTNKQ